MNNFYGDTTVRLVDPRSSTPPQLKEDVMRETKDYQATLLLVDDSTWIVEAYKRLLPLHQIQVVGVAPDGAKAVETYMKSSQAIDLILMDYDMPFMNGVDATRKILEFDPLAVVFMMSSDPTIQKDAILAGAKGFLHKPFAMAEFISKLDQFLIDDEEVSEESARFLY